MYLYVLAGRYLRRLENEIILTTFSIYNDIDYQGLYNN